MTSIKILKIQTIIIVLLLAALSSLWWWSVSRTTEHIKISETHSNMERYEWRLITTWPKGLPGLGSAPENFAKMVHDMSDGRLDIKVYGAGEIVGAMQVFDTVSSGSAEMGHGAAYYWKGKIPAAQFFTSVPFGMTAQEMNGWLHYGGGMELWREIYEPFDLVPFAGGNTGVQMGGWYNREINTVADLQGLKMRMPGLGGDVLNRAGATTVTIPGGELFTSLKTGVIDATEWVGPYNDLTLGFHQVAKYYYYPGWHEPGPTLEFIVNKSAYEALPKELQVVIEVASRAINQDMLDEYTARNNDALRQLIEVHSVELRRTPDDVFAHLHAIAYNMYDEMSEADPTFAKVWSAYRTFQEGVSAYHKLSEEGYYQLRRKASNE